MGTILKNGINYSGTSGGSGVSSYTELTEKPKINNVTLTGNKSTSDLGISYNDLTDKPTIPTVGDCYETGDAAETAIADNDYFPFQDVSANGRKKSLWSNIKSALKSYFDTQYAAQYTAGTNIGISGNVISATNTLAMQFNSGTFASCKPQAVGKFGTRNVYMISGYASTIQDSSTAQDGNIAAIPSSANISRVLMLSVIIMDDDVLSAALDTPFYIDSTHYFRARVNSSRTNVKAAWQNVFSTTHYLDTYIVLYYT